MSRRNAFTLALIGLAALVVVAAVILVRDDSDDPTGDTVADQSATTTGAGDVATTEPATTTEAATTAAGDAVTDDSEPAIEVGGLAWRRADLTAVGYDGVRIVETDDGFLALGYKIDEGEITTWSSVDGRSWSEISAETEALLPGEFIMKVVATPTGYLATGGVDEWGWGDGPVDRMWASADGATWIREDFDLADAARPSPYLTGEGTVGGLAAGPTELVLVGQSVLDLDHQAILDEYAPGTDAGELMMGVGILEPSGKPGVEYALEEGWVRLTFEELGLSEELFTTLGTQTVGVWHSGDGSTWSPCPQAIEWDIQEYVPNAVAGPKGYLLEAGDLLFLSPDGEVWSEISAESAFGMPTQIWEGHVTGWADGWAAIVPAGVVPKEGPVEGTDFFTEVNAVWISGDGVEWSESVVPTSMLLSDERGSLRLLFGGEFGLFAVVDPMPVEEWDPSRGLYEMELWWSTDAVTWDPIQAGPLFGTDRFVSDLTISADRAVALVADLTGWQDAEENPTTAFELWVATAA